jgi:hypothetical protein
MLNNENFFGTEDLLRYDEIANGVNSGATSLQKFKKSASSRAIVKN